MYGKDVWDNSGSFFTQEGAKHDQGKFLPFKGFMQQFPAAVLAVAALSEYGANKYDWDNWKYVPDGAARYTEAMLRHLLEEANEDRAVDAGSDLPHIIHTAWNAMARLELYMREEGEQLDG